MNQTTKFAISSADEVEFQTRHAVCDAEAAFGHARSTLERALHELERYESQFKQMGELRDKALVMNWTLNFLASSVLPNLRLDLISDAQMKLMAAEMLHDQLTRESKAAA